MKTSIKFGGVVRCDMVTVRETKDDMIFEHECSERFITYSESKLARGQAANAGWGRIAAKLVQWPGDPPMDNNKKADLCPEHAKLGITPEQYKAKRKAEREAKKAEAKAAKPKKPRKKKQ
jgi:hypothetical protein